MFELLGFGVFWFICAIIAALIGDRKGEGVAGFLLGLLLGPLGIIAAALSRGNRMNCPYCKELINKKATVCPHCQREIELAKK